MKQKTIIIILVIIIVAFAGYFGYERFNIYLNNQMNKAYQQGAYDEIININSNGIIPILDNSTGNVTIKNMDIKTVCTNLGLK